MPAQKSPIRKIFSLCRIQEMPFWDPKKPFSFQKPLARVLQYLYCAEMGVKIGLFHAGRSRM